MLPSVMFGLVNVATGCLCLVLGFPLMLRKVRMNRWYGVRLPKSFASDENWYKINEYGGRQLMLWALPLIVLGGLCLAFPTVAAKIPMQPILLGTLPTMAYVVIIVVRIGQYVDKM
jgi:uncharacterized membrane protein